MPGGFRFAADEPVSGYPGTDIRDQPSVRGSLQTGAPALASSGRHHLTRLMATWLRVKRPADGPGKRGGAWTRSMDGEDSLKTCPHLHGGCR